MVDLKQAALIGLEENLPHHVLLRMEGNIVGVKDYWEEKHNYTLWTSWPWLKKKKPRSSQVMKYAYSE